MYALQGWLTRKWQIVPVSRIQSIDTQIGLIQRYLRLARGPGGDAQRLAGAPASHRRAGADPRRRQLGTGAAPALRLRTVHIGSGESETSFTLDGLDHRHAARVQRELMPGQETVRTTEPTVRAPETIIARLRRPWVPLNAVTVWSVFARVGPLFGLYWMLRPFGIDLLDVGRGLWTRTGRPGTP